MRANWVDVETGRALLILRPLPVCPLGSVLEGRLQRCVPRWLLGVIRHVVLLRLRPVGLVSDLKRRFYGNMSRP